MEKQKLAELVLQKMKEKRELQQKNRPHYQVLRLEAVFAKQLNDELKQEIKQLESQLSEDKSTLSLLQAHLQQLDNTGKRNFPRIIIKPEFIASEHIQPTVKQFYRKTSNSFLRIDILRKKGYQESIKKEKLFLQKQAEIRQLQDKIRNLNQENRTIMNAKRVKVLKEDLRLRSIRQQQRILKQTIQEERYNNRQLLKQYEIKKVNLQSRKDRLKYIEGQIIYYKQKIEQTFNPLTYREHLKKVFAVQIKNQIMHNNLKEVSKRVSRLEKQTKQFQKGLVKTSSLVVFGRVQDSPSTKKGLIQKRLSLERQRQTASTDRSLNRKLSHDKQRNKSQTFSHSSLQKSKIELDLTKAGYSSTKTSMKTTDRSNHHQYQSEIKRKLF